MHLRPIRSFVRREGRMSSRQRIALEQLWAEYGLTIADETFDLEKVFGRAAPTILEIGFGMGQSLLSMAQQMPEINFIGVEVHRPGVGALLAEVAETKLTNIKIICADAVEVLTKSIADTALDGVQIFFPDPWPKKRHHKRRLIQTNFIELIQHKLKVGGCLHLATDWENYAIHMLEVIKECKGFHNSYNDFAPRPDFRPLTKYEKRGHKFGHGVWDLIVIKQQ